MSNPPLLHLFIVATVVLAAGYSWGRRRNLRVARTTFSALLDVVQPIDRSFTNIGGLTGYHATFTVAEGGPVTQVQATLTLLPRQAWLYLPVSWLFHRHDRFFIHFTVHRDVVRDLSEGHLIDRAYARSLWHPITTPEALGQEPLEWGEEPFSLYFGSGATRRLLLDLRRRMPTPGALRHVAVAPANQRVYLYAIPGRDDFATCLETVYAWIAAHFTR
jgi:hypothetical protein